MPKKSDTYNKIRMAIVRIERGAPKVVTFDRKISVASVAEEAGVSDSLIHKDYPELLGRIKKNQDKDYRSGRNAKHQALKAEREKNRENRARIAELESQLKDLASINASLELRLADLKSVTSSKNVAEFRKKGI